MNVKPIDLSKSMTLITPEIAEDILKGNTHNRDINRASVARIAYQMSHGQWKENTGETIKIDKDGVVIDGQHRLYGIIKSNKPTRFIIQLVDNSAQEVIDSGVSRTSANLLTLSNIKNSTNISTMVKLLISYQNRKSRNASCSNGSINNSSVLLFAKQNEELLQKSIAFGISLGKKSRIFNRCAIATIYYILDT